MPKRWLYKNPKQQAGEDFRGRSIYIAYFKEDTNLWVTLEQVNGKAKISRQKQSQEVIFSQEDKIC